MFSGADGNVLFELAGELASPGFGRSLDGGDDVDGDGTPDLVVERACHWRQEPCVGLVLLYSGRTGELIRALGCEPESPVPAWKEAGLYGVLPGESILHAVALLPDRDEDGRAELAVCLTVVEADERGDRPTVLEVVDPWKLSTHQRSELPEHKAGSAWLVRSLGDADGDEVDDVLLSVIDSYVLLYSGATGDELRRHEYLQCYMNAEGTSLDVIDDLDGDGVAEYLIGANEEIDVDCGFSRVRSGATGELLHSLYIGELKEIPGRALPIHAPHGKCVGIDTCALGDTNDDGVPDVAVHMPAMEEVRILSGVDYVSLIKVRTSPLLRHNVKK